MMLSPAVVTRTGMGFRFGKLNVQPARLAVALSSNVTSVLSPVSDIPRTRHLPATSASEIAAVAGASAATAAVSAAGCF